VAPLPNRILNENLNSPAGRIITMRLIFTRLLYADQSSTGIKVMPYIVQTP